MSPIAWVEPDDPPPIGLRQGTIMCSGWFSFSASVTKQPCQHISLGYKMAKPERDRKSNKEEEGRNTKKEEDRQLSRELEMSFPASDPPSATQPGSGITGPEVTTPYESRQRKEKPAGPS
jgi:hypothetical protein